MINNHISTRTHLVGKRRTVKNKLVTDNQYAMLERIGVEYDEPVPKSETSKLYDESWSMVKCERLNMVNEKHVNAFYLCVSVN
jgi:hypothetical protein